MTGNSSKNDARSELSPAGDEPFDVVGYLWSLRRLVPLGLVVAGLTLFLTFRYFPLASSASIDEGGRISVVHGALRVEAADVSASDAEIAASSIAGIGLTPPILDGLGTPFGLDSAQLRSHLGMYGTGALVNVSVSGLPARQGRGLARGIMDRLAQRSTAMIPATLAGELRLVTSVEPYVSTYAEVPTRSRVQGYLIRGLFSAVVALGAMVVAAKVRKRRSDTM